MQDEKQLEIGYAYLKKIEKKEKEIVRITMTISEMRRCLLPSGQNYENDRVQTSAKDKMCEIEGKVDELERERSKIMLEKAEIIMETKKMLDEMKNEGIKTVITGIYIAGLSVDSLSRISGYSRRQIFRLRKSGALLIGKKIEKK